MGEIEFTGEVVARGPAAAFVLDEHQVTVVGGGAKRFPVVAVVNGHEWRTTVTRMRGEFLLGLSRAVREAAGIEAGDTATVRLTLDLAPREVEVPPALAAALERDQTARAAFERLAFTHRKEFARWVAEAKREQTRDRRVAQAIELLREGRTRT